MNRTIKKMMIAGLACLAFCGTLTAAPARGNGGRAPQKAPAHQNAKKGNGGCHNPAPANNCAPECHRAPVAHYAPPPVHREPEPQPPPPPPVQHCEGTGWVVLGAVVGGIVGASL